MKLIPLPFETRVATGFSHKAIITFADMVTAGLTQRIQLLPDLNPADELGTAPATNFGLPAGTCIRNVGWQTITPFSGGTIATFVMDIGIGGTVNKFVANSATDLFTSPLSGNSKAVGRNNTVYVFTNADVNSGNVCDLEVLFTSTVGNVNAATAGQVEIYFELVRMDQLPLVGEPG